MTGTKRKSKHWTLCWKEHALLPRRQFQEESARMNAGIPRFTLNKKWNFFQFLDNCFELQFVQMECSPDTLPILQNSWEIRFYQSNLTKFVECFFSCIKLAFGLGPLTEWSKDSEFCPQHRMLQEFSCTLEQLCFKIP